VRCPASVAGISRGGRGDVEAWNGFRASTQNAFCRFRSPLAPASVAKPSTWSVFRPHRSPSVGSLDNVSPGRGSLDLLHRTRCVAYRKWLLVHRRPGHPPELTSSVPTSLWRQIRMTDSARSDGTETGAFRVSRSTLSK
jgi:hypothetical protein